MRNAKRSAAAALAGLVLAACEGEPQPADDGAALEKTNRPLVYVVNYPLQYFAECIGSDLIDVNFPAPPDVDPAFWSPDVDTIAAYQQADLLLLNGAGYARWIRYATLPESKLVDTSHAFADKLIHIDNATTHSHGPTGEHSHGETAFTTWLDMDLAVLQAMAVRDALTVALPPETDTMNAELASLVAELEGIGTRLEAVGRRLGDAPLLYSHPVYQYLNRRYGFNGQALHWEPDEFPIDEMWRDLDTLLATHPAALMLWEGPPIEATRQELAERNIDVVVFDPAGNRPDNGDFGTAMNRNVSALENVIDTGT